VSAGQSAADTGFSANHVHYPQLSAQWKLLSAPDTPGPTIIFYVFAIEFFLDLFKYAATLGSGRFSGSLALVGGLVIGDIAVDLRWANAEILFYGALTLLTSLALSSIVFADGLRIYRLFLLLTTAIGGGWGFAIGLLLILLSVATTPVFGQKSYLWPLVPFHGKALMTLLFRRPAYRAQPERPGRFRR
jgi:stage V sporulation protein AF